MKLSKAEQLQIRHQSPDPAGIEVLVESFMDSALQSNNRGR
jgi:hypothetical protein